MEKEIYYIGDSYDNEVFAPQFFEQANFGYSETKGMIENVAVSQPKPERKTCWGLYSAGDFHSNR